MTKPEKRNAYQRLANLTYRRKYHITFLGHIPDSTEYPTLVELGI